MPSISVNQTEFEAELETVGLDEVRARLASKYYTDLNERGGIARAWVVRKEQLLARESDARNAATQSKHIEAASLAAEAALRAAAASERSAEAAERQATTAERASRTAIAALAVAVIALIFSVFQMFPKIK